MEVSRVCRRVLNGTTLAIVLSVANLHCGDDDDDHPPGPSVGGGNAPVIPERPIPQPGPDSPPNLAGSGGRGSIDFGGNGGTGIGTGTAGSGIGLAGFGFGGSGTGFGAGGSPFPGVGGAFAAGGLSRTPGNGAGGARF